MFVRLRNHVGQHQNNWDIQYLSSRWRMRITIRCISPSECSRLALSQHVIRLERQDTYFCSAFHRIYTATYFLASCVATDCWDWICERKHLPAYWLLRKSDVRTTTRSARSKNWSSKKLVFADSPPPAVEMRSSKTTDKPTCKQFLERAVGPLCIIIVQQYAWTIDKNGFPNMISIDRATHAPFCSNAVLRAEQNGTGGE